MIVAVIFAFGTVLVLGLSCLGVKLARDLVGPAKPSLLTKSQENNLARIKALIERAEQEDRKQTGAILDGLFSWEIESIKERAAKFRREAKKIAKESGIKLVDK